ncbi:hypothetical protein FACS1894176_03010 [Bacteroidia bacterium]|nr:hypothetical protein FACS1894176_03010 [Bacteroidia bacterium]
MKNEETADFRWRKQEKMKEPQQENIPGTAIINDARKGRKFYTTIVTA